MEAPKPAAVDIVAKSQLAFIHAAITRPQFTWETIQGLARLWLMTNSERYRQSGMSWQDVRASTKMVFRDYLQAVRNDDPREAERLRQALEPELEFSGGYHEDP